MYMYMYILGCAVRVALPCLFNLACFFLPSFSSLMCVLFWVLFCRVNPPNVCVCVWQVPVSGELESPGHLQHHQGGCQETPGHCAQGLAGIPCLANTLYMQIHLHIVHVHVHDSREQMKAICTNSATEYPVH